MHLTVLLQVMTRRLLRWGGAGFWEHLADIKYQYDRMVNLTYQRSRSSPEAERPRRSLHCQLEEGKEVRQWHTTCCSSTGNKCVCLRCVCLQTLVCCRMAWACASCAETTAPVLGSPPDWNCHTNTRRLQIESIQYVALLCNCYTFKLKINNKWTAKENCFHTDICLTNG